MSAKMERLKKHPGIYKRGGRYLFSYREDGQQRWETARTIEEAEDLKAEIRTRLRSGERQTRARTRFDDYAREWLYSYRGRTNRGFRPSTRKGYRFSIEQRAIPFFDKRIELLSEIEPPDVRAFVTWLFEGQDGKTPAVNTVRAHVAALKVLLATAMEDGLIRHNPASGVRISRPDGATVEPDAREQRRALDSDELARFLNACAGDRRLFFELLTMTGIRIGEAVELRWEDVDFGAKRLRIRRQFYRGRVGPPKSKEGTRDIPLSTSIARALWVRRRADDQLLFTSPRGERLDRDWCWKNVLKPAAKTAGVPWVGFHTFRHTCASLLFAAGKNAKQVQMWLGHSDPGFTMRTYIHLIDDGLGDADFLDEGAWRGVNKGVNMGDAKQRNPQPLKVAV
jgi:integrase